MAIHAVDLACSKDSGASFVGGANSYASVWLTNFIAWEPDGDLTQDNEPPELTNTALDGSGLDYYRGGIWRFEWSEDKSILLDNLEGQADAWCPWYRIRWHECDHDQDDRPRCQWDDSETQTGGAVPSEVP